MTTSQLTNRLEEIISRQRIFFSPRCDVLHRLMHKLGITVGRHSPRESQNLLRALKKLEEEGKICIAWGRRDQTIREITWLNQ